MTKPNLFDDPVEQAKDYWGSLGVETERVNKKPEREIKWIEISHPKKRHKKNTFSINKSSVYFPNKFVDEFIGDKEVARIAAVKENGEKYLIFALAKKGYSMNRKKHSSSFGSPHLIQKLKQEGFNTGQYRAAEEPLGFRAYPIGGDDK